MAAIASSTSTPATPIIFFDIPSKSPARSWSLNTWKTRMLLNYKGLNYETKWLEYPEIRPTLEGRVEINPPGATPYTVPAIKLPNGTWMQDSKKIASHLETLYPDAPPIHPDTTYMSRFDAIMPHIRMNFAAAFLNKVPTRLLNDGSLEYWYRTREASVGMPLDEFEREKGDAAFQAIAPHVQSVTAMLKERSEGPFFEGERVTYVDFVWVSLLKMMERLGHDMFEGMLAVSGDREVHVKLYEACRPWLERED